MNKWSMGTILYGKGSGEVLTASTRKVGMESDIYHSRKRPASAGRNCNVKLSLIADAVDRLFTARRGPFAFAVTEDCDVYAEFDKEAYLITDNVCWCTDNYNIRNLILGILVYTLVHTSYDEIIEQFYKAKSNYDKTGKLTDEDLFILCDSFYYDFVKKRGFINYEKGTLEEIAMSVQKKRPVYPDILVGTTATIPLWVTMNRTEAPAVSEVGLEELLTSCQRGDYIVPYSWDETQAEYIQPLSTLDGYIPNETFRAILKKIQYRTSRILARMEGLDMNSGKDRVSAIGNDHINLTLSGKPGTGKTKLAYMLAASTGLPIYTVANSHNTDEDEYEGKTKMVDGRAVSVETDTLKCVEHGGILLLEEANLVNAAVIMGALGQLVEFPYIIKKFGYQPVRRHPLCIIITTMNVGTAGSKAMSQPFANRFKQSYVLDDPTKDDFIRILQNTGAKRNICKWVYECYERITACIESDNGMADVESILLSLSLRTCVGAIENIQEGMQPKEAVINSIIGKIAEQDRAVAVSCRKVLDSMRECR